MATYDHELQLATQLSYQPRIPISQVATYDQFKELYKGMGLGSGLTNQFASSMSAGLIYAVRMHACANACTMRACSRTYLR